MPKGQPWLEMEVGIGSVEVAARAQGVTGEQSSQGQLDRKGEWGGKDCKEAGEAPRPREPGRTGEPRQQRGGRDPQSQSWRRPAGWEGLAVARQIWRHHRRCRSGALG